jgi:hypothetical protein
VGASEIDRLFEGKEVLGRWRNFCDRSLGGAVGCESGVAGVGGDDRLMGDIRQSFALRVTSLGGSWDLPDFAPIY